MKISFIGDIMLGRFVQEQYHTQKYNFVSYSTTPILDTPSIHFVINYNTLYIICQIILLIFILLLII